MKLNNYSINEYAQVLDKLARAKTVHNATYMANYTAESLFWSILSFIFQNLTYIIVYPIVLLIISVVKTIKNH